MKIDPNHLMMLSAIVTEGGLGEGAEALGKSQPSVSRSVAMLEARLGTKLFEPGKRPLRPTDLCRKLAADGARIAEATQSAQRQAQLHSHGKSGRTRLAGTPVFMDGVVSGMLAQFQHAFPDIMIEQSYGYLDELAENLRQEEIDLAICPVRPDRLPAGLSFKPILRGHNVIACAPSHPLARRGSINLSDIAPFPWIAPPAGSPLYNDLRAALTSIGVAEIKVSFTGGSLAAILNVLGGGQALTVLPYSVVVMHERSKTVTALPVKLDHPERDLGLLWRTDRDLGPTVKRCRAFIETEFVSLARLIEQRGRDLVWPR